MDLNINVLVVDDFASMRRIVKGVLKQIGFTKIIEAEDGADALGVLKREAIDLVLADWNMPRMTGIELLKAVRDDESLKDAPFIMVTAEGQKDNVVEAVQAGVSNYIMKPFTPQTLEEKVKKVLN
jgi:two-component system chemotaxis response regulator CheY